MKREQEPKQKKIVEYWETERLPSMHKTSPEFRRALSLSYNPEYLKMLYETPFLPFEEIERRQFERIKDLVNLAYRKIPVYREKYQKEGFKPEDLKSWNDYHRLPVITKDELIEAFPHRCINPDYKIDDLFPTRSSGSSGKTLRIYIDSEAIIVDTLQGVRQFWLQSEGRYDKNQTIVHVYTVPWWVDSLGHGDYQSIFISSLINPREIAEILREIRPEILSLYPTNLHSILPFLSDEAKDRLRLVVIHSEMSSREERDEMSRALGGIPVLDEYSSEELTRIALELPCGHYHSCEDTVRLDVVNPNTMYPIEKGVGLVVGTNLLNSAMPFIKYVQGDFVSIREQQSCGISWRQIEKVEGRQNDAFLRRDGLIIPAGTILDISYRWMFDIGINIQEFEIVQTSPIRFRVTVKEENLLRDIEKREKSFQYLHQLLGVVFGKDIVIDFSIVKIFPTNFRGKRRPIRREF